MSNLSRPCSRCGAVLPLEAKFFYRKRTVGPETRRSGWSSMCRPCVGAYKKEFWRKHNERLLPAHRESYYRNKTYYLDKAAELRLRRSTNPRKLLERRRVQTLTGVEKYIHSRMSGWRSSAKRRNLSFELTVADIVSLIEISGARCYHSGESVLLETGSPRTISLDRIDSQLGYTLNNTVVCTRAVNSMKHDLTLSQFYELCEKVLSVARQQGRIHQTTVEDDLRSKR